MFKKALAVALTTTMVLSMGIVTASADTEVVFGADGKSSDAALLEALNSDPASVTFTFGYTVLDSHMGWGDGGIQCHVVGEEEGTVHQWAKVNSSENGVNQVFTCTGTQLRTECTMGNYPDYTPNPMDASAKVDWVEVACWNDATDKHCKATIAGGAAATGAVVPVAVISLLGVSAAGAMIASKKRA